MAIRLVLTLTAAPGRGAELAQAFEPRCAAAKAEDGCEQFEIFQGLADPDTLVLLERWRDQPALDAHAKANATRPPLPRDLVKSIVREDYEA